MSAKTITKELGGSWHGSYGTPPVARSTTTARHLSRSRRALRVGCWSGATRVAPRQRCGMSCDADLPVDFDPVAHPILAVHFFGLQREREVAA